MDDCTRKSLAAYADHSIPRERVVDVLKDIIAERGKPKYIIVDNGPEFRSKCFMKWCEKKQIDIRYINPGRPMQNAYIKRLNRTFREDLLDDYQFDSLEKLRILCDEWQYKYNYFHTHKEINRISPAPAKKAYDVGGGPTIGFSYQTKKRSKLVLS